MNDGVGSSPGGFRRNDHGAEGVEGNRRLLDSLADSVFELDLDGQLTAGNDALLAATGYDRESLLGEHVSVVAVADDVPVLERTLERLRANPDADIPPFEICVETATGESLHWELRLSPVFDEGDLVGTAGVARETSGRERERQSQQHRRVMRALEASHEGVSLLNDHGTFIYVNDAYAETFGYDPETMIGEHWEELGIEEDPNRFTEEVLPQLAEEGQWSGTSTFVRADGGTFPAQHSLTHTDDDELICVVRDISDRRERERELRRSERRYRALVENFPNGAVGLVDETMRYVTVGGTPITAEDVSNGELEGSHVREVLSQELSDVLAPRYRNALQGEASTVEYTFDRADRHARYHVFPVRDDDGEVFAAMGMSQEITEHVERERKLEESNERLEQFAYAASHDLQEPLRMVSSYLTLIEERYEERLDEEGREFLEFAVDGADRMREMIHGLLDYSRIETHGDPFEPVDLDAVFADVRTDLELRIEESDAEISVESLPRVSGDRGQLYQLFQNLLGNAVEYSGDEPPQVHVSAERRGSEWAISVDDDGLGMDPEQAERAFELFQRLHPDNGGGTGIGLALCERIVERHGGDIRVASAPGEGTTFTFTLPARGEKDA